jgi:hypothetical protein
MKPPSYGPADFTKNILFPILENIIKGKRDIKYAIHC